MAIDALVATEMEIPTNGNGTAKRRHPMSEEARRNIGEAMRRSHAIRATKVQPSTDPIIRLSELASELEACDARKGEIVIEMRQYRAVIETLAKLVGIQVT